GLKATLKLGEWTTSLQSAAYDIAVGAAVAGNSAIAVNKATYTTGDTISVTVTLKDMNGNAVTGKADLLTDTTVQVPNAEQAGKWIDGGDGTYSVAYTAEIASNNNHASLKLSEWSTSLQSGSFTIEQGYEAPSFINTQLDDHNFEVNSEEGKFPTTGFNGATFTIVPKDSKSAADYLWKSDASWVSVNNGVVKFIGSGSAQKVTITGTPKSGKGNIVRYKFMVNAWYLFETSKPYDWSGARSYCLSLSGYSQPTFAQLTNATPSNVSVPTRAIGPLWNEWGDFDKYGFGGEEYWVADQRSSNSHYMVSSDGTLTGNIDTHVMWSAICRKTL
ncbi:invasin, partial [Salmonella enterica]|nr:invasin [Salmonella enterica]